MYVDNKDVKLSLTVLLNKERNRVFYAVADNHFVDILLSFLTLPLGRIVKVLTNHYGEKAATIGSLNSLYHSLANLDSAHFVTEAAKKILLNPTSSFEAEYEKLKLDFTDSPPAECFHCRKCIGARFRSLSLYYDKLDGCFLCNGMMSKEVDQKRSAVVALSDGVFTKREASFVISSDLHIFPNETRLLEIIGFLGEDKAEAEVVEVEVGFNEVMDLLKASLTSPTPLSDIILNKTTQMNSPIMGSHYTREDNPISWNLTLKLIVQKSTGKLLYAQAKEEFVEFLFSLLFIPLGGVGHLLAGNTCFKAINNLYKSTTHLIDDEYFKNPDTKNRVMKPDLPHGCISQNYILPLTEKGLLYHYTYDLSRFSSDNFPKGQGSYLQRSRTYEVKDDLSVVPSCYVSFLASLKKQKILLSDVTEVEKKIGLKEALSILRGTLTSTSALSGSLLTHMSNKNPKREI